MSHPSFAAAPGPRTAVAQPQSPFLARISADPRLWLLLITGLGLLLRCLFLSSKSFWMDEGFSVLMARTDYPTFFRFVRGGEINMLAYYGLLRLWTQAGFGESFIRSLSVLASAATIPLLYLIGKRLFSPRVGLVAAALLAVHPSHIAYAQEARSYALAVFLVCLGTLFLLRGLSQDRIRDFVLYAGTMVLAIYSLALTVLVPLALAPAAILRLPARRLRLLLIAAAALVVLLPALFVVWRQSTHIAAWIPPLSGHMLLRVWRFLTLRKFGFLYALAWAAALWAAWRGRRTALFWPTLLAACWLVLPLAALIALSIYKALLIPRVMLMCVPAAALLAAQGLESLRRPARWTLFALLVLASLAAVRSYYRSPKPDWRGVTTLALAESQPGDGIVVVPEYARFTVDYYRELSGASARLPDAAPGGQMEGSRLVARRLWLAVYGGNGYNPPAQDALQSVLAASRNRYCVAASSQFSFVELFLLQACPPPALRP